MVEFASQIINGLAVGNIYALLALGFSLVFGVANLINFAQGSLFMLGAYFAWTGAVALGLPLAVAVALAVALTAAVGILIDWAALRPVQQGPLIAPLLTTLAVSVIVDHGAELIWTPDSKGFPNPLSGSVWLVGGAYISAVDALVFGVGVIAMIALTLFLEHTWMGRAIRATAQDFEVAMQMGVDVELMRRVTFGLAGGLGGLAGVLVGMYYQNIFPAMGLSYGLKGFTAALLGGITSLPGAIAGGMLLGVFESLTSGYIGSVYRNLVAYLLLLLVLFFRPQGLLGKRTLEGLGGAQAAAGEVPGTSPLAMPSKNLPRGRGKTWRITGWPAWMALALAAAFPLVVSSPYWLQVAASSVILVLFAVSLTIPAGTAGQISIGHAALFGVGAYVTAIMARKYGFPAEVNLLLAAAAGAVVGVVCALPAIRLSGHAIPLATLAAGQILYLIYLTWIPVTRGPMGIPGIPYPVLALAGHQPLRQVGHQYWLALALLALSLFIMGRLLRGPIGRAWRAVREDRLAARAAGLPVGRYIAGAFAVGGFLAALAGGLYAYLLSFVSPDSFDIRNSILVLTMAVLGGLGNLTGAVLGGALLAVALEVFRDLADYRMIGYGLLLLLVMRWRPHGIAGSD